MTIGKYGNVIFGHFLMYRHILGVYQNFTRNSFLGFNPLMPVVEIYQPPWPWPQNLFLNFQHVNKGCSKKRVDLWNGHNSLNNGSRNKIKWNWIPTEVLLLMGTEIFQFRSLGAEKIRFEVSYLMYRNMTQSILPQTQSARQRCPMVDIANFRFDFLHQNPLGITLRTIKGVQKLLRGLLCSYRRHKFSP